MDASDAARLIARLERFCAELYRTVPLEGAGLVGAAEEIAQAAALETEAEELEQGQESDITPALTPRDIGVACQVLIDVRRTPHLMTPEEVTLARHHFPEVEAESLDPLETLIAFYMSLLDEGHDATP